MGSRWKLIVGLAAVVFAATVLSVSATDAKPKSEKYEYKVVAFPVVKKVEGAKTSWDAYCKLLEDTLNKAAKLGWELEANICTQRGDALVLKRPEK